MEEVAVAVGEGNVLSNTTEYLHQLFVVDQQALPVRVCAHVYVRECTYNCTVAIHNLWPNHKHTTWHAYVTPK